MEGRISIGACTGGVGDGWWLDVVVVVYFRASTELRGEGG